VSMPDEDNEVQVRPNGRTVVALAERLAVVETKVDGLKEDSVVIRATHHEINNRMQEFVAAEKLCAANLGTLISAQSTTNSQIAKLTTTVEELLLVKARVEGGWKAIVKVGAFAGAVVTAMAGVIVYAIEHLSVRLN